MSEVFLYPWLTMIISLIIIYPIIRSYGPWRTWVFWMIWILLFFTVDFVLHALHQALI